MALEKLASDLFGGKKRLRERLIAVMKNTRLKRGLLSGELYEFVGEEYSPEILAQIESGRRYLDGHIALSVMAPLGISLERAMPLPKLTEGQKLYWITQYLISGDGPVHGLVWSTELLESMSTLDYEEISSTKTALALPQPVVEFDDDIQLGIWLRLKALRELDTP